MFVRRQRARLGQPSNSKYRSPIALNLRHRRCPTGCLNQQGAPVEHAEGSRQRLTKIAELCNDCSCVPSMMGHMRVGECLYTLESVGQFLLFRLDTAPRNKLGVLTCKKIEPT